MWRANQYPDCWKVTDGRKWTKPLERSVAVKLANDLNSAICSQCGVVVDRETALTRRCPTEKCESRDFNNSDEQKILEGLI